MPQIDSLGIFRSMGSNFLVALPIRAMQTILQSVGLGLAVGSFAACSGATVRSFADGSGNSSSQEAGSVEAGPDDGEADATAFDSSFDVESTAEADAVDAVDASQDDGLPDVGTTDVAWVPSTITFVSGDDWPWFAGDLDGADGGSMGTASVVCVTPTSPPNCPPNAVVYQTGTNSGWQADTSALPNAYWIWRGDVSPYRIADLEFAVFQKSFFLGSNPTGAISIAADDFAEVRVNGSPAGGMGSVTNVAIASRSQSALVTFDLGPYLVEGVNTITVIGQNGPASFASCYGACTYAQNTAGVVFGGTLTSY